ncbi:MAG: heme ABC exporter ATP-binding protein CcmA [Sphingomonadaceae bacterium]|nr:heme ABC exporter ATP-binding protein CcmA [Sphingomonadaceae bacterium]
MQECHIAVDDLACRRGDQLLFSDLSLVLSPGEALHVSGPNGIGKSSLIRILGGLLRPVAGTVKRKGAAGLLDEHPALDPAIPLGSALAFWQRIDGGCDNALARLGLSGLLDVPVGYLSTGQKKRAALARLFGQNAPIWLLDEPLNGLDSDAVALTESLTAEHCRAGGICIIASHQPFTMAGLRHLELAGFAP